MTYQLTSGSSILRLSDRCSVDACTRNKVAKGYCRKHYDRVTKNGSPDETDLSTIRGMSAEEHFIYFFNKCEKDENGCMNWAGAKNVDGYGRIFKNPVTYFAHRLSYLKAYGHIDDSHEVCHKCDNPSCVNPEHLFLGTTKDNAEDRERKGRGNHKARRKSYCFVSPDGIEVSFTGLVEFCRTNGLSQPKMTEVWYGSRNHHKGWTKANA